MNASKKAQVMGASPTKTGGMGASQIAKGQTAKTRKSGKSPTKKNLHDDKQEKKESGLASPTSISMQNSFIIKNADESFDAYHQQMRKRKLAGTNAGDMGTSIGGGASATMTGSPAQNEFTYAVVSAQPSARDGHSAQISDDGLLFVFGGDRHLMPFNDLYIMGLD